MKKRRQGSTSLKKNTAEVKISHILRRARLQKNYSLTDLYKITKIKPQYLKDLETGQFTKLPGGFYIRAFIKKYADTVGIDGTELLRRYNNKLPDLQDPHYMNHISEDKLLVNAAKQRIKERHSTVRKYIPLVSLIIIVMLVLIGIWIVASHYHGGLTTHSTQHSTTVSGMSSSAPSHKKHRLKESRKSKSRPQIMIHRQAVSNGRLTYRISTYGRSIRIRLMSAQPAQLTVELNNKAVHSINLKAKRIKEIKVPTKTRRLQFDVSNVSGLKFKVNNKVIKLNNNKPSVRSVIFRFIK